MRILLTLSLFYFFFLSQCYAQGKSRNESKKGEDFIINNSYDTIWGKVVGNLTPSTASLKIGFIDNKTGTKSSYKPYQIRSWHPAALDYYFESKEYRPKGLPKGEQGYGVFMKCFTPYQGQVRCYEYYNTDGMEGYYQTFLEKKGVMTEVRYEKFFSQLSDYFSDYKELSEKIKSKKYKKNKLTEIVDEYNRWFNKGA